MQPGKTLLDLSSEIRTLEIQNKNLKEENEELKNLVIAYLAIIENDLSSAAITLRQKTDLIISKTIKP